MLKIFLDLERISITKLVGEFRTVSAAFSKLRTLCLLLFCTLCCAGSDNMNPHNNVGSHSCAPTPFHPLLFLLPLPLLYSILSLFQHQRFTRVACQVSRSASREEKQQANPFERRQWRGGREALTLLIDAEYIIKPVTYICHMALCRQHICHIPNLKSQLQFMDFPALMNHNVTWNEFNEAAKAPLNIHR